MTALPPPPKDIHPGTLLDVSYDLGKTWSAVAGEGNRVKDTFFPVTVTATTATIATCDGTKINAAMGLHATQPLNRSVGRLAAGQV